MSLCPQEKGIYRATKKSFDFFNSFPYGLNPKETRVFYSCHPMPQPYIDQFPIPCPCDQQKGQGKRVWTQAED
jgi:hypothetical protein